MLCRRDCLLGALGAGLLGGKALAADTDVLRAALAKAVGANGQSVGIVALTIAPDGAMATTAVGSSGTGGVALDGDTVFQIMSNTKVLTALLLADMADRGEVAFDDPVAKYLPSAIAWHSNGRPITLLDLATYRSGMAYMPGGLAADWYLKPDPLADYSEAQLVSFLSGYAPKYAPGVHYQYDNLGFGLLSLALARAGGKSFEALVVERICDPLGMARTRVTPTADMRAHLAQGHDINLKPFGFWDAPLLPGIGSLRSTANDLARLLKACMGGSALKGAPARLLATRAPTSLSGTDAAMAWFVTGDGGEEIVWKSGLSNAFSTFIGYSPKRRRGAVVLCNFLWRPIDSGTITIGVKAIKPDFTDVNFNLLYGQG